MHPGCHPAIPLKYQFLTEILVDLLSERDIGRAQRRVYQIGHLSRVVFEYDGVEIAAVVVPDEVLCGIEFAMISIADALLLPESLIQSKEHLGRNKMNTIRYISDSFKIRSIQNMKCLSFGRGTKVKKR